MFLNFLKLITQNWTFYTIILEALFYTESSPIYWIPWIPKHWRIWIVDIINNRVCSYQFVYNSMLSWQHLNKTIQLTLNFVIILYSQWLTKWPIATEFHKNNLAFIYCFWNRRLILEVGFLGKGNSQLFYLGKFSGQLLRILNRFTNSKILIFI